MRVEWMFDQISAASELDFVTTLRAQHSDAFAMRTMRNHWANYISDEMLDAAATLGVDAVRIPVGYWIVDAPVGDGKGTTTALDYGFSPEGFVTGGLNYLLAMLPRLRARGIVALIDVHALPCNSACVSDGIDCANPLAFAPPQDAAVGPIERCTGTCTILEGERRHCDGQHFTTSRHVDGDAPSWGDVGLRSIGKLAQWISELPAEDASVVAGLQLANEPALNTAGYDAPVKASLSRRAAGRTRPSAQPASRHVIHPAKRSRRARLRQHPSSRGRRPHRD